MNASKRPKIAVALSGGVDSAVTSRLLMDSGADVIGLTMRLVGGNVDNVVAGAAQVANALGIDHHVIDLADAFHDHVLAPFADAYASGLTPLPCALCNRAIKFGRLLDAAKDLGAEKLATGHYVRLQDGPDGPELHRAVNLIRDQSYFLFTLPQDRLGDVLFPLGGFASKDVTRQLARDFGLAVSQKPDSQDLCFAPKGDHRGVVLGLRPDAAQRGDIVDDQGRVLGTHTGLLDYTIGQRKGLGLGGVKGEDDTAPLYVTRLEPSETGGRVVVGPREALARQDFPVTGLNWLAPPRQQVLVKIRNLSPLMPARVEVSGDDPATARVVLDDPASGVAPGQAAAFYDPQTQTRLLGGGWIGREKG